MSNTKLTAPKHLRGRMSRHTPQALRDERLAWAIEAHKMHKIKDIATALGIYPSTVGKFLNDAGVWRVADPLGQYSLYAAGIKRGHVSEALSILDRDARADLFNIAARKGLTVAEAMAVKIKEAAQ